MGLKTYSNKPLFSGETKTDTFYFLYFLLHIPITVLVDSALAIPHGHQLSLQKSLIGIQVEQNKDFLLANPPSWLVVFGWIELVVQLPFFVIGSVALYKSEYDTRSMEVLTNNNLQGSTKVYPYLVAYGLEASITTACCLVAIWVQGHEHGLNHIDIISLIGIYLPTFLIPFYMTNEVLSRDWKSSAIESKKSL